MFIIIFEDGTIKRTATFTQADKDACEAGVLTCIQTVHPDSRIWNDGVWNFIEEI